MKKDYVFIFNKLFYSFQFIKPTKHYYSDFCTNTKHRLQKIKSDMKSLKFFMH